MNPGDLRVAHISCGNVGCHPKETLQVKKSMMTHGCMLWGAALYNNGSVPNKWPRFGESYGMTGVPQRVQTVWKPEQTEQIAYEMNSKGVVPFLDPLPRFEISQPGNILRIFEPGGRFRPEVGVPEKADEPGRPSHDLRGTAVVRLEVHPTQTRQSSRQSQHSSHVREAPGVDRLVIGRIV